MTVKSQESRVESQSPKAEGGRRKAEGMLRTPPSTFPLPPSHRGLTLIELLVVIIILTTIVAAAIPIMTPADDDRRLREASRAVNTFISSAQSRQSQPTGPSASASSAFHKIRSESKIDGVCVQLYYVEQLPPYSGFDENSARAWSLSTTARRSR